MITIKQLQHPHLAISEWQVLANEHWCILGRNGSGKQYIDQLLLGELTNIQAETLSLPPAEKVRLVSFEAQQAVFEHELKMDRTNELNQADIGRQVKDFLPADKLDHPLIKKLHLEHKLTTGYRQLSTGESRKVLILEAIFSGCELLICDNPFDSLDVASCQALSDTLHTISNQGINILLLLSNRQDIPTWCDKIAFIERNKLSTLGDLSCADTQKAIDELLSPVPFDASQWPDAPEDAEQELPANLVEMNNCTVTYNNKAALKDFSLTITPQQHTLITGPNGSGKSTLVQLITGDCTQCYSNDVNIFGYQRGSGESIWQLKKSMGIVSSEMHRAYRVNCNALTVVASGFSDSIGIYSEISQQDVDIAKQWLAMVGMAEQANCLFQQLSYGEQRLILIARALVKAPWLLLLDEPTQGLDELNRHRVLNFLEKIAASQHSTIVLVSHRSDEYLPLFKQHVQL
ncbi:ATP-binding cassette domain-containing protein [Thalassotalea sp. PLHSN55]|uniref:ATP-binding cassette domain-containing protein n=1 Tax=Thalassotalea sp. PLHSN55 TaxID=3435888 RepID=UPI003F85FFC5